MGKVAKSTLLLPRRVDDESGKNNVEEAGDEGILLLQLSLLSLQRTPIYMETFLLF